MSLEDEDEEWLISVMPTIPTDIAQIARDINKSVNWVRCRMTAASLRPYIMSVRGPQGYLYMLRPDPDSHPLYLYYRQWMPLREESRRIII